MSTGGNGRRKRVAVDALDPDVDVAVEGVSGNGDPRQGEDVEGVDTTEDVHVAAAQATHQELGDDGGGLRQVLKEARNWREIRQTKHGLMPMLLLSGIGLFQGLDAKTFVLAIPEIIQDLDFNIFSLIGVFQIIGVLSIFATIVVGWWADRHARVPIVAFGAIFSGIFSTLSAGASSVVSLGWTRTPSAVTNQIGDVPNLSLFGDYYAPQHRGKVIALFGVLSRFADVLAPLIIGVLVFTIGWRTTFIGFGVPTIVLGVLALFLLKEPIRGYWERRELGAAEDVAAEEEEPQSFGESWRTIWAVRTLRRLIISLIFTLSSATITSIFVPIYLSDVYGLNILERGLFLVPAAAVGAVGVYLGGGVIDVLTRRNPGRVLTLIGAVGALSALGWLMYAFAPPLWLLLFTGAVFGFFGALVQPAVSVVLVQVIPPSVRTMGVQLIGIAAVPGLIFGLPLAGAVTNTDMGMPAAFLLAAPLSLIGALIAASAGGFFELDMRNAFAAAMAKEDHRKAVEAGTAKLLVCRDVDVAYDGVQVLFGVDFDVEEGEIIALLGTNGAGKSTLLRAISGTQEASAGGIVMDGRDITHMPPHEIARRGVIHMPGGRGIFPGLTVRENLLLGAWMIEDEDEQAQALEEVYEIFPVLYARASTQAGALSGGEQQQLSLAQAFLGRPKLLMIDELSLGLAPAIVAELLEKVREIHARGTTIIIVEQSVNVALTLAERAIFMEKGEVRFFGETEELLRRPDILRAVYVKGTGALTSGTSTAQRSAADQRAMQLEGIQSILQVAGLTKRYGGVTALDGVGFDVTAGMVLGVIGPNGSGKTTMFDLISGFQKPDGGTIRYLGEDITGLSPEERARKQMIRRFQDARLFPSLTVYETLLVALEQQHEARNTIVNGLSMPHARKAERRQKVRADRLVELLELGSFRDKFIKDLSTGLRRIVDLACTLAAQPKLLLLDEPSSGIAQSEAEGLAPLLRRVRHETGTTILMIEHDMPLLSRVADELLVLESGKVLTRGVPNDVLNDERVIEAYLGTSEEAVQRSGGMA